MSCCACTLGKRWPWLLFSLEELRQPRPRWPAVRGNWVHRAERRHGGEIPFDTGIPPRVPGRSGMCRRLVVPLQGCPLPVVPTVATEVARIPASLWHIPVGESRTSRPTAAATPARFNQQAMPDTCRRTADETNAIGISGEKSSELRKQQCEVRLGTSFVSVFILFPSKKCFLLSCKC